MEAWPDICWAGDKSEEGEKEGPPYHKLGRGKLKCDINGHRKFLHLLLTGTWGLASETRPSCHLEQPNKWFFLSWLKLELGKYQALIHECQQAGWHAWNLPVEVGCRGPNRRRPVSNITKQAETASRWCNSTWKHLDQWFWSLRGLPQEAGVSC